MPLPNRRWLRFSMRTMLLLWTVVTIWGGWNLHRVHQRRDALSRLRANPAYHLVTARWLIEKRIPSLPSFEVPPPVAEVPIIRHLLGDSAIQTIYFAPDRPEAELRQWADLFPEAELVKSRETPDPPRTNGRAHSDL
jgi:hypothetical protein